MVTKVLRYNTVFELDSLSPSKNEFQWHSLKDLPIL